MVPEGKVRGQIERFSGKLSAGLPKTARRMVREVLYGIQSRGSVLLSEIVRCLCEPVGMKKRIDPQALLVVNPTDIVKAYGMAMPYLVRVRDGYWCCKVVAAWRGPGRGGAGVPGAVLAAGSRL